MKQEQVLSFECENDERSVVQIFHDFLLSAEFDDSFINVFRSFSQAINLFCDQQEDLNRNHLFMSASDLEECLKHRDEYIGLVEDCIFFLKTFEKCVER